MRFDLFLRWFAQSIFFSLDEIEFEIMKCDTKKTKQNKTKQNHLIGLISIREKVNIDKEKVERCFFERDEISFNKNE